MRIAKLLILLTMLTGTAAYAAFHPHDGEAFELILSSVDDTTATELTAARDAIDAKRDELQALKDAGADSADVDALLEELKALRQKFAEDIRAIVEGSEELQAQLRDLARESRAGMFNGGFLFNNEDIFNEIFAAATTDQQNALLANQGVVDGLKSEIQTAKEAGATREELAPLLEELRVAMSAQRDLVKEILDGNEELRESLAEQAREARHSATEQMRERMRDRRPGGPGHKGPRG